MFLPWYQDADGGGTLSAWGGYWFLIAEMLLLFLAGAWLALSTLAGRPLRGPALHVISGLAFVVTITVVIALFIARPGGNTATTVAFGGYAGLAAINMIKGGAILMTINAHRRVTMSRPLTSESHGATGAARWDRKASGTACRRTAPASRTWSRPR